jgi:hypothetical protein
VRRLDDERRIDLDATPGGPRILRVEGLLSNPLLPLPMSPQRAENAGNRP